MNPVRALLDRAARRDPATFAARVMRDERSGAPIVLAPAHRRLHDLWTRSARSVAFGFPEMGKTSNEVARVVWTLGTDPSARIVIASGTAGQAEKLLRSVASYVESSADVRRIFPSLKPGAVWRTDALSVAGSPAHMKDPNVSTAAPGSGSVLGLRCDLLILDDVLTRENTRTQDRRAELLRWYTSTLASRLAPDARVIACGTVWHRADLLHTLAQLPGFAPERFPVLDASGAPTWPERWPASRITERRAELGSREFARAFMCEPIEDSSAVFRFDDVDAALKRGADLPSYLYSSPAETGRCFIGIDPAFTTGEKADLSAMAVVCVRPNGERELLDLRAGRWGFDGIIARVVETAARYRANTVALETNGGGSLILDDLKRHARGRVVGLHTSAVTKAARIERLSAELEGRRWILPCRGGVPEPDVRALVQEILAFTPEDHMGDRLSALVLALDVIRTHENRPRAYMGRIDLQRR